jgi:hypothetical protein
MLSKRCLALLGALVLWSLPSHALLEIGGVVAGRGDTFNENSAAYDFSTGMSYHTGLLGKVSLLPFISLRTGVIQRSRHVTVTGPLDAAGTGTSGEAELKDTTLDIPINAQFDLPLVGLYAFGGVIWSKTQSSKCESKTAGLTCGLANASKPDDFIYDLGVGYKVLNFPLLSLGLEAQVDFGNRNLGSSALELKQQGYSVGLAAWFGI